jgi:hypothetical protein
MEVWIRVDGVYAQFKVLKKIYKSLLKEDITFHFFFEIGYLLIRFDKDRKDEFDKALRGYEHLFIDEWKEDSETVRLYQGYFADLFHLNSKFALEEFYKTNRSLSDDYDFRRLYERITHTSFDMLSAQFVGKNEPRILAELALGRSMLEGQIAGGRAERARIRANSNGVEK